MIYARVSENKDERNMLKFPSPQKKAEQKHTNMPTRTTADTTTI